MNISTDLINAVLNYLGNRPYVEVANLITAIQAEAAKVPAPEQIEQPIQD
jgi:hypothetical protein